VRRGSDRAEGNRLRLRIALAFPTPAKRRGGIKGGGRFNERSSWIDPRPLRASALDSTPPRANARGGREEESEFEFQTAQESILKRNPLNVVPAKAGTHTLRLIVEGCCWKAFAQHNVLWLWVPAQGRDDTCCVAQPPIRLCEPTGRANARPMTGSAKQSIEQHVPNDGLLRRFALRNDGKTHLRILATQSARVFACILCL
jgi:hypothetical protein